MRDARIRRSRLSSSGHPSRAGHHGHRRARCGVASQPMSRGGVGAGRAHHPSGRGLNALACRAGRAHHHPSRARSSADHSTRHLREWIVCGLAVAASHHSGRQRGGCCARSHRGWMGACVAHRRGCGCCARLHRDWAAVCVARYRGQGASFRWMDVTSRHASERLAARRALGRAGRLADPSVESQKAIDVGDLDHSYSSYSPLIPALWRR